MNNNNEYRRYCQLVAQFNRTMIKAQREITPKPRIGDPVIVHTPTGAYIVRVEGRHKGKIFGKTDELPTDPVYQYVNSGNVLMGIVGKNLRNVYAELRDLYQQIADIYKKNPEFSRRWRKHQRYAEYARDMRKLRHGHTMVVNAIYAATNRKYAVIWCITYSGKNTVTMRAEDGRVLENIPVRRAARLLAHMTRWHEAALI